MFLRLIKKLNKVSQNGIVYSYDKEPYYLNKKTQFIKNIWNTEINELSEIFNTNEDTYNLIEVINENKEEMPSLDSLLINKNLNNLKIFPINIGQDKIEKTEKFYKKTAPKKKVKTNFDGKF